MLEPKGNCSPVRKELRWFFYVLITRTFLKTVYNSSETAAQGMLVLAVVDLSVGRDY